MTEESVRLPKRALIRFILDKVDHRVIREKFSLRPKSSLESALEKFTKSRLASFLFGVSPASRLAVRELEQEYPLRAAPTLYVVLMMHRPPVAELLSKLDELAKAGHAGSREFGDRETVRAVYLDAPAEAIPGKGVLQIRFAYLLRVDFTHSDPMSPDFGEPDFLYSLEKALFWLPDAALDYAVVCCCDHAAVDPIRMFTEEKIGLEFITPDFSPEMLQQIAKGGKPRSATFTAHMFSAVGPFDVKTLTISDRELGSRRTYKTAAEDEDRPQTSGFYSDHPLIPEAGLGIASRSGRVWTPCYLDLSELLELGLQVIERAHEELSHLKLTSQLAVIRHARHMDVRVGRNRIGGKARDLFERLLDQILAAADQKKPIPLESAFLRELLVQKAVLQFVARLEFECDACEVTDALACPMCRAEVEPRLSPGRASGWLGVCSSGCERNKTRIRMFECECGHVQAISTIDTGRLILTPLPALEDAIQKASAAIFSRAFQGIFQISKGELAAFGDRGVRNLYVLGMEDLRRWTVIPNFRDNLQSQPWDLKRKAHLQAILSMTKEKCTREVCNANGKVLFPDGSRPTREKCKLCLSQTLPVSLLSQGKLCLPRVFGIPIGEPLDGVHHGHEVADVRYEDGRAVGAPKIHIGIHLKSRARERPQGLGRSHHSVKELYTQLFDLGYRIVTRQERGVDVLGVSIPNRLKDDVRDAFRSLAARLGLQLLILEEKDWLAIVDAAENALSQPPAGSAAASDRSRRKLEHKSLESSEARPG